MIEHYKVSTGLSEDKIKQSLLPPHDVWLTAEEALAAGICDSVSLAQ
jgi:ATP-dependent protease ClpP protease subunit